MLRARPLAASLPGGPVAGAPRPTARTVVHLPPGAPPVTPRSSAAWRCSAGAPDLAASDPPRQLLCLCLSAALVARATRPGGGRRRRGRQGCALRAVTAAWEPGVQDAREFASEEAYLEHLRSVGQLPAGFKVGVTSFTFVPQEADMGELPMRLTILQADEPTEAYAAVFTSNAFPGAPVLVGRRRLEAGRPLQAIAVNNKVSNVFPSDGSGQQASEEVCAAVAKALGLAGGAESVLPCSTGVIGWRLPVKELCEAAPRAAAALQAESALPGAKGIMTTDRYAKVSSATLPGGARIVGFAKGAGMVEPNMATMLCYLLTDADVPGGRELLQSQLADAVTGSFNAISVDGDESTSDTVVLLSSRRLPCEASAFADALGAVCQDLAAQVVRNGEGTEHVMRVVVTGARDNTTAARIAKAVVNGPLFKSAVAGNDPNVGRLVGKVGQALSTAGAAMAEGCVCRLGGEVIFDSGRFALDSEKERRLSAHLKAAQTDSSLPYPSHHRVVDVEVLLGGGGAGRAVVLGSDLTKEYVEINADYRS